MRYTTIIDLSEYPQLYRSTNARLLYLHLVLKSGYHDDDRDLIDCSLRRLAMETGLTFSAVRCALDLLLKYNLVSRQGPLLQVRKFVLERSITPRAKSRKQEQLDAAEAQIQMERQARAAQQKKEEEIRAARAAQGKNGYIIYVEGLKQAAEAGDPAAAAAYKQHEKKYLEAVQALKVNK